MVDALKSGCGVAPSPTNDVYFRVMYGSSYRFLQHKYATTTTINRITIEPPMIIHISMLFDLGTWSAGEPVWPMVPSVDSLCAGVLF